MNIIGIIDLFFWVYMLMLFARIFSSWVPEIQQMQAMRFVAFCTDPYLNIFKKIIPPLGMIDISPMVAFLCLSLIDSGTKAFVSSILGG
jgi:YggT family protein